MASNAPWFYDSRYKAYGSWDYKQIQPLVYQAVRRRRFPSIISFTQIWDWIERKVPEKANETHAKQSTSRVLKLLGYEKGSDRGKAWYRTNPIMLADIRQITPHSKPVRSIRHKSYLCMTLSVFFPV